MINNIKLFFSNIPRIRVDRFRFLVGTTFILTFIENIPSFINRYYINLNAKYDALHNIFSLFIESLIVFSLILLILFVLSWSKWLLKIVIACFLCITSIFIYMLIVYKVVINEVLFLNLMQANAGECKEIFSLYPVMFFISLGLIPAIYVLFFVEIRSSTLYSVKNNFLSYLEEKLKKSVYFIFMPILFCLMVVLLSNRGLFFHVNSVKTSLCKYMPLNYIASYFQYTLKLKKDMKLAKNTTEITNLYNFNFNSPLKNKPLTIVLVIGESASYKQQAYSGYYRDTNKYTRGIPGLVYLRNVTACSTYTAHSVPCMLSYKTRKEFSLPATETGLISVFKHLGFKTYWISTQTAYSRGLNPIFRVAAEASEFYFVNSVRSYVPSGEKVYDGITVNTLFTEAINSNFKHKLIVLQLAGSHIIYRERFPENFAVYKPNSKLEDKNTDETLQNDYNNSILYTDYILSEIIKKLKEQNSLLIYMSDHGESLPEDKSGFLVHAAPYDIAPKEQTHVAALMWLSSGMQKLLPYALNNIKKYSNLPISHDYIYSTLLGSIGVESATINENLNLCSNKGIKEATQRKYH